MNKTLWKVMKPHIRSQGMTVGIWKAGKIAFSLQVFEEIGSHFVNVLYDGETHRIALEPTTQEDTTAHKINKVKDQNSWWVSLIGTIKYLNLNDITSKRYRIVREGDLLIIDLNEPISETKPRGPTKKEK